MKLFNTLTIILISFSPIVGAKEKTPEFRVPWRCDVNWNKVDGAGQVDEKKADQFLGKTILIMIYYKNDEGFTVGNKKFVGKVVSYSKKEGIKVKLQKSKKIATVPPAKGAMTMGRLGTFIVDDITIEDPDLFACWICRETK